VVNVDLQRGQVVISKAGRDSGKAFLIFEMIDDDYVLIVDGQLRKIGNPKRKKKKHLNVTHTVIKDMQRRFEKKIKVMDEEIRKVLEIFP
jgi:large subunit ribosomal protein L14e